MKYKIKGNILQTIDFELADRETLFCESSGMAWMSANIEVKDTVKGGITKSLTRILEGESVFFTAYTCRGQLGLITFAARSPGKIVPVELKVGQELIYQRNSFICAQSTVNLSFYSKKALAKGMFGNMNITYQKLTGPGLAFFDVGGDITEYNLKENQILKVDPGHVVMFEATVTQSMTQTKGFKHWMFGGNKTYLNTFKGPGRIWLQSMSVFDTVKKVLPYLPANMGGKPLISFYDDGWGL